MERDSIKHKNNHHLGHRVVVFIILLFKDLPRVVIGIGILIMGLLFLTQIRSPFHIIIGLPGTLIGASFIFLQGYEVYQGLLDESFSISNCPICKRLDPDQAL